ncbi:unnamed protein product [Nippostrongylus brasiliensis]|uniref:Copine domain-containing protein n=1 Tax=Nippostrongylus brasiliensis TaxID=27835 RepID=A0A0N4XER4_NIPBR|nr:unnamed protein product [Nippostrongylus brasiliensis]
MRVGVIGGDIDDDKFEMNKFRQTSSYVLIGTMRSADQAVNRRWPNGPQRRIPVDQPQLADQSVADHQRLQISNQPSRGQDVSA